MRHLSLSLFLGFGVFILVSTELLNITHAVNSFWVTLLWIFALIFAGLVFKKDLGQTVNIPHIFQKLSLTERILSVGICIYLFILLIIALYAPPNTWDSMGYHMARVAHWVQNHSIDNYPTNDERQIWKVGFAEYAILHLQLLFHNDRFANLVQWFSCLGSIIAISLITKNLGCNRFTQILSAVIVCTIPMGILQATSTQNDYVASFWMICFVYYIFQWIKNPNFIASLCLGASLALALATKEINFIYSLPLLLLFIYLGFKGHKKKIIPSLFMIIGLCTLINAPHWLRNHQIYGHFLSSSTNAESFLLQDHGIKTLISNVLLNIGNHLKTPWENINTALQNTIAVIHQTTLGMGITTSKANMAAFHFVQSPLHEDNTGNFLHLILIITSILLLLFIPKLKSKHNVAYALMAIGLFASFIFLMKWSVFHNRVQLLIFIAFAPLIADTFSKLFKEKIILSLGAILLVAGLPWLLCNVSRPLLGDGSVLTSPREKQYFANLKGAPFSYYAALEEIKDYRCNQVGYALGEDHYEYPLWALLHSTKNLRIEHVLGKNSSFEHSHYPLGEFTPCAIIEKGDANQSTITFNNEPFQQTMQTPFLSVYINVKWAWLMRQENP